MPTIKIKRGLREDLPANGSPGEAFFCLDTGELFIANNMGTLVEVNSYEANYTEKIYNSAKNTSYNADALVKQTERVTDKAIHTSLLEIYGGGTITWSSSYYIRWTSRIIVMGAGRGSHFSTNGCFLIYMPSVGATIARHNNTAVTVTDAGIPLAAWETLYYLLPIGSGFDFSVSNFIIYRYDGNGANFELPYNALPLFFKDNDNNCCYLFNRTRLEPGGSTVY